MQKKEIELELFRIDMILEDIETSIRKIVNKDEGKQKRYKQ